MAPGDEQLVDICNHGDAMEAEAAFARLYEKHKSFVLRVALRYVSSNDMALDVLQETFIYLLKKFPPAGSGLSLTAKLTTLLYPVAKNIAITQMRKANRFPVDDDSDPDNLPADAPSDAIDLHTVLNHLSPDRREIIQLRFIDDLSLNEIAETLQIPLGTVKSRLHLAIKDLRNSPGLKKSHFS